MNLFSEILIIGSILLATITATPLREESNQITQLQHNINKRHINCNTGCTASCNSCTSSCSSCKQSCNSCTTQSCISSCNNCISNNCCQNQCNICQTATCRQSASCQNCCQQHCQNVNLCCTTPKEETIPKPQPNTTTTTTTTSSNKNNTNIMFANSTNNNNVQSVLRNNVSNTVSNGVSLKNSISIPINISNINILRISTSNNLNSNTNMNMNMSNRYNKTDVELINSTRQTRDPTPSPPTTSKIIIITNPYEYRIQPIRPLPCFQRNYCRYQRPMWSGRICDSFQGTGGYPWASHEGFGGFGYGSYGEGYGTNWGQFGHCNFVQQDCTLCGNNFYNHFAHNSFGYNSCYGCFI